MNIYLIAIKRVSSFNQRYAEIGTKTDIFTYFKSVTSIPIAIYRCNGRYNTAEYIKENIICYKERMNFLNALDQVM